MTDNRTAIRLLSPHRGHVAGSTHMISSVVPHGGNYDCALQYVLEDGTHIPSDHAEVINDR